MMLTFNEQIPDSVCHIVKVLQSAGYQAYLVGGCVRDMWLCRNPKDWDIATDAYMEDIRALFPNAEEVGQKFSVALVNGVEVATFRIDGAYNDGRRPNEVRFVRTPEEDSLRRDFTINALYYDPIRQRVMDFHHGVSDLVDRRIRCVGNPYDRFREDYLRMLRAVRFGAGLHFTLDPLTLHAIKENAHNITGIAKERIQMELSRILTQGRSRYAIHTMNITGLLQLILNPVWCMQGVEQPKAYHPEGDVYRHTLYALSYLPRDCSLTLALATLLHDCGKPVTAHINQHGRISFNNHDVVGAAIAARLLRDELRYSNDIVERVTWLIMNHMRVYTVDRMRLAKLRRFMAEPGWDELMDLVVLDCKGSMMRTKPHPIYSLLRSRPDYEMLQERLLPTPLITGDDLIAIGIQPGPRFKVILTSVQDAQLENKFTTKHEALDYVSRAFADDIQN